MVQSQQMKGGGMEFITVGNFVDCLEAEFIGLAIGASGFDSTTGQPSCESSSVMIASLAGTTLCSGLDVQIRRCKLQSVLEHTTGFKIFEQGGHTGIKNGPPVPVVAG